MKAKKSQTNPLSVNQGLQMYFITLDINTEVTTGFPLLNAAKKKNNKLALLERK